MDNRFTRLEITRILKDRGWVRERGLWFYPTVANGHIAKHMGVSLRDAASLECLSASENLDTPRRRK